MASEALAGAQRNVAPLLLVHGKASSCPRPDLILGGRDVFDERRW